MATVVPAHEKYAGLRGFAENYVTQALQNLRGEQIAKQLGQVFGPSTGISFAGIKNPIAQQAAIQMALQQLQPASLRAIGTGDVTSIFDPRTGKIIPTKHPSAKVGSTNINLGTASPTERQSIAEGRASIDALDNLKSLFDSTLTRTGPLAGRVDPVKGLLGLTSDEQEAFMAATSAFKNAIIKEITGAQMSEQEAKRIMKQIPDITDPPKRWLAKWEQSKKNLDFLQKRRLEILRQSGFVVPGETPMNINGRTFKNISFKNAREVFMKYGEAWEDLTDNQKNLIDKAWGAAERENKSAKEFMDAWRKIKNK